ncbi:MAG: glycine/betaine ABC transporter substrate-binding protein [Actinobacteria bacterium]|nr:glycine/betaine ABC transporter substrate-binding protein [Actinomycetota bacterium]MCA1720418.1 glycine/betaine ABC transporter substrate-binding protein [Actinomycetota bacterium]
MRARTALALAALTLTAAACGGSSGDTGGGVAASTGASTAPSTAPVSSAGDELVVLEDDLKLQTVDNIVPVVTAKKSTPALETALNRVSAALTTDKLVAMNRQADVERKTPPVVAKAFVKAEGLDEGLSGGSGKLVVGAANFSENQILANVFAEVLKVAGFDASVKPVTSRDVYGPALERGELNVMPEYVGTLTEYFNKKANGADAAAKASGDLPATLAALRTLAEAKGLKVLEPAEAADQNAFAVTKTFADANNLTKLSDLKAYKGELVLGGPPECPTRPFCQPGLEKTYGLMFTGFKALDAGGPLTKTALKKGDVQIGLVFSSDGSLSAR